MIWLGHDPDSIPLRQAIRYVEHAEEIWEHRMDVIAAAIGQAFA